MEKILNILYKILGPEFVYSLVRISDAVKSVFEYLSAREERSAMNLKKTETKKAERALDDACDKGQLKDLIDATANLGREKSE